MGIKGVVAFELLSRDDVEHMLLYALAFAKNWLSEIPRFFDRYIERK